MTNIDRFENYSKKQGLEPDVYLDLLKDFERFSTDIIYLEGSNYHNADYLVTRGFLQQVKKPIIDEYGEFRGFKVGYCHPEATLVCVEPDSEDVNDGAPF